MPTYGTSNYTEQGGARDVIGGSLDVVSGGELDIESGGALKIAGTAVTSTAAELNILDGVTSTAAELNILDGVTSTAAELNILDGVTSTAAELNILDGVTSTAAELDILDGVTATTAEINALDLSAVGTADGVVYTKQISDVAIGAGTGVNSAAGVTLLAAVSGKQYKLVDVKVIAVGGNLAATAAATGIGVYSDPEGTPVLLFNALLAAATENTVCRIGDANTAVLAAGASFDAQVANKPIALKAVSAGALDLITATSFEVVISYTLV